RRLAPLRRAGARGGAATPPAAATPRPGHAAGRGDGGGAGDGAGGSGPARPARDGHLRGGRGDGRGGVMDEATAVALGTLGAALLLDRFADEYPTPLHPVVWMGAVVSGLLRLAPAAGWWRQLLFGALLTAGVVALFTAAAFLLMHFTAAVPFLALV